MRMRQHGLICFIENHFIMKMHINEINVCLMLSQLVCQLPQAILLDFQYIYIFVCVVDWNRSSINNTPTHSTLIICKMY